jgi:serine/threonine protein kinase
VSKNGQVKLLDFGIAKLLEGEGQEAGASALTTDGGRAMTPEFAAPEQITGAPVTTATDVYMRWGCCYTCA